MNDMMRIDTPAAMQELALEWRKEGLRVGLVPTMGYWHEGHLSLMRWAREHCDVLVASIFVNPTQFGPGEDLENYPSDVERDSALARDCGVDVLFTPVRDDMYSPDHGTWVTVPELTANLCGRSRPIHFRGVATVVCKLFNLVQPAFAAFGEKDWQQLAVIRKMARELNFPVRVEGRPIVREADGLAMSSRNVYLTPEERAVAPHIQKGLRLLEDLVRSGQSDGAALREAVTKYYAANIPTGKLDYLELVDPSTIEAVERVEGDVLAAVAMRLGKARLIDNKYIAFGN
jgi:pantoate--beta-alanine ligase